MQKWAKSHLQTNSNTGSSYSTETCLKTVIIHALFRMLPLGVQKWHNLHLKSASVFFFFTLTKISWQTSHDVSESPLFLTIYCKLAFKSASTLSTTDKSSFSVSLECTSHHITKKKKKICCYFCLITTLRIYIQCHLRYFYLLLRYTDKKSYGFGMTNDFQFWQNLIYYLGVKPFFIFFYFFTNKCLLWKLHIAS